MLIEEIRNEALKGTTCQIYCDRVVEACCAPFRFDWLIQVSNQRSSTCYAHRWSFHETLEYPHSRAMISLTKLLMNVHSSNSNDLPSPPSIRPIIYALRNEAADQIVLLDIDTATENNLSQCVKCLQRFFWSNNRGVMFPSSNSIYSWWMHIHSFLLSLPLLLLLSLILL